MVCPHNGALYRKMFCVILWSDVQYIVKVKKQDQGKYKIVCCNLPFTYIFKWKGEIEKIDSLWQKLVIKYKGYGIQTSLSIAHFVD